MGLASNGTVELLNGANGYPLWVRAGSFNYGLFGSGLLLPGDLNGDGSDDVLMICVSLMFALLELVIK